LCGISSLEKITRRGRWIGRDGSVLWPPGSPDLTPQDFFLWGYVKSNVFLTAINGTDDLKTRIRMRSRLFQWTCSTEHGKSSNIVWTCYRGSPHRCLLKSVKTSSVPLRSALNCMWLAQFVWVPKFFKPRSDFVDTFILVGSPYISFGTCQSFPLLSLYVQIRISIFLSLCRSKAHLHLLLFQIYKIY
jgi:hypothetical protein